MEKEYDFGKIRESSIWDGVANMPMRTFLIKCDDVGVGEVEVRLLHTSGEKPGIAVECRIINFLFDDT